MTDRTPKKLFEDIGNYLGERRVQAGLSLEEAAALAGCDREFLQNIERGVPSDFSPLLMTLLKIYKIDLQDFLETFIEFKLKYYQPTP